MTISADTLVTATFTLNTYNLTLTTAGNGSGTVSNTPSSTTFNYGTVVTVTATPNTGSSFTGWSPNCTVVGSDCVVTISADTLVTATFTLNTYNLTLTTAGNGSGTVSNTPSSTTFNYGTVVTVTATPNTGSSFTGWSSNCTVVGSDCVVTISADTLVTATFTLNNYDLTIATTGTGSGVVTPTVGLHTYLYGTVVALEAVANMGSTFAGWSGDADCTDGSVTMDANKSCTATFTLIEYTLTVNTVGSGTVSKKPDQATYHYGDAITLTAVPAANWAFVDWSGDLSGSDNPTTITIDGNKVITATFSSTCSSVTGADFTFSPTAPKVGQSVNFTATVAGGTTPITYTWNFGHGADVVITAAVTAHSFPLTTTVQTYNVSLTAANACTASPVPVVKQVTVWPYFISLPLIMR